MSSDQLSDTELNEVEKALSKWRVEDGSQYLECIVKLRAKFNLTLSYATKLTLNSQAWADSRDALVSVHNFMMDVIEGRVEPEED